MNHALFIRSILTLLHAECIGTADPEVIGCGRKFPTD